MPVPDRPTRPAKPPPEPQNHLKFDTWQSPSTGHQRAGEGGSFLGSTSWRQARSDKLSRQYRSGDCLPTRQPAGSGRDKTPERNLVPGAFDGKCASQSPPRVSGEWAMVSGEVAARNELGVRNIRSFMSVNKRKASDGLEREKKVEKKGRIGGGEETKKEEDPKCQVDYEESKSGSSCSAAKDLDLKSTSNIFAGVTVFVNGSTLPQISEYKLKHLLVGNGARTSIYMARKTVTHVIIGQPNTGTGNGAAVSGAGGGLAAGKLQQEIARGGWKGVKVVSVDWAIESIRAGRRLAESRFPGMHVAAKGQRSVAGMFGLQEVKK
ncbi:hypothetical protein N7535_005405 [Penicillium sp. DV-2018c]|nr:hypothetical protein N7535_005405 [Penicillium sp. DV-2018c]